MIFVLKWGDKHISAFSRTAEATAMTANGLAFEKGKEKDLCCRVENGISVSVLIRCWLRNMESERGGWCLLLTRVFPGVICYPDMHIPQPR